MHSSYFISVGVSLNMTVYVPVEHRLDILMIRIDLTEHGYLLS